MRGRVKLFPPAAGPSKKINFYPKSHSAENVAQCRKTLYPILKHCRSYSLSLSTSLYIDNHSAPYLYTSNQVVSQSELSTTTRLESSANQNRARYEKNQTLPSREGWKTLLGSGLESARYSLKTCGSSTPPHLISSHIYYFSLLAQSFNQPDY